MNKYLLLTEQEQINKLITLLSEKLYISPEELYSLTKKLTNLIKNTKDDNIEDILTKYFYSLQLEMGPLLQEKITSGLQFGIQNDNFTITGYGGTCGITNKPINQDTFFSFDSISKLLTSLIVNQEIKNGTLNWDSKINDFNSDFTMDATIESILKFTAMIKTEKRIDHLNKHETIDILKRCKENLQEKAQYKNFYEYNDIGFMILRLSIPDFLSKLDNLLNEIDSKHLTYHWEKFKTNITGGKINEEFITPDPKGRDILFPGHTGIYGNIEGLLNLLDKTFYKNIILTPEEKEQLLKQPYPDPTIYTKEGTQLIGKNTSPQYMTKISGVYRKPTGIIEPNFNKLASCDISSLTTDSAIVSTGTCGSWIVGDNLSYKNHFNHYVGGILTNPYSYIEQGLYPNKINNIPNTNLTVNQKGVIIGYPSKLNRYKELITEYGLLLELLTQYIRETDKNILSKEKYKLTKKLS